MKLIHVLALGLCAALMGAAPSGTPEPPAMYPDLAQYVSARVAEFDQIDADRRAQLDALAEVITGDVAGGRPARLTFICTHNSRRSHLAQAWATVGAGYYGVPGVQSYSGGIEVTAFNPRAVEALRRAGFRVDRTTGDSNPIYLVRMSEQSVPETHFSKIYDQAPNPGKDYCAVLVCSHADESCPHVAGATARFAIPYEDPKAFDGSARETEMYDERCRQIAREILYVFSCVQR